MPEAQPRLSAGSGVIVDADKGLILTNHHVVADASDISVTLKDRRRFKAELVGSDQATDIAVLRIKATRLTALPFGNSDTLRVGDSVVAIGNPFGLGQTVTLGLSARSAAVASTSRAMRISSRPMPRPTRVIRVGRS
nr:MULTISPECIES: trypsin-like peptidase domain-containing protein [unclassified Mesorhizobium]